MSLCQTPKVDNASNGLETLLDALETDNSNTNKVQHKIDIIKADLGKYAFTDR